ncbi:undecaprenyl-diphosphatase [Clostridium saccharoperbutylacetonicum]|uniref:Membrane-associated phospholipid phosphatase n=1 Tax=Clostridium saccharoperbutylacetonicum N1-4(HMT) TaxID=931276 RepID=M1MLL8_9CLOT|nr:phosphatase PAP2 family protein [Clostridium saccharoperbutylacetonicum]AGF55676.1 membrane-associated phospholipid phosphatase [Clostridium saccharoperbutylacetonicum N1-4(HMT)]NRT63598.1 undecaprenyl-diphosphatase [Clostridium saccharoperbutylacetonicum]NSB26961.1 undecaprenyl-diphosphatase [Clostridium saccharoperbutylacetonicum]NSB40445.1 undecaprenyl-diphosphatase [Clostridium saccharoperbutylacetonicum]
MNMEIFKIINNLANKNIILDKIMIFFSEYGPYIFMAAIVIVFISGLKQKNCENRKIAVSTVVVTVINLIINIIVRSIFHVDRPFVHNKVNLLLPHDSASSFPSNHATGTMSIALGLEKYNKLLSRILTILSIIIGFSRVYVGHHYPMDVIGGYIIVFAVNYIYNLKLRSKVDNLYELVEKKIAERLGKLHSKLFQPKSSN